MALLWTISVFLFLALLPILSWVIVVTAPFVLIAGIFLSAITYGAYRLDLFAIASTLRLSNLENVLRGYLSQLESQVKVCSCYFVKDGRMHMAAQFQDGDRIWNYWSTGSNFNEALLGMQGTLAQAGSCPPKCGSESCAKSANCPARQTNLPYKVLRFAS